MPTRLLELALGEGYPKVKLVHTAQIKGGNITYATLSHCWGNILPARLLKSLVEEYSLGIPWASLSPTFQDTIIAVLKLNIKYLWIDALCIMQDDTNDWTYEAAQMVGIYFNSYLNISADASRDGTEGLFRQRNPNALRCFIVPREKNVVDRYSFVLYTDRWWSSVEHSPLADRAWAVQERYLAPRVLHFADEEVHWECRELFTAECLPVAFNTVPTTEFIVRKSLPHTDLPASQRTEAIYRIWYQLVSTYVSASLTFASDRPIAIAGLACTFCRLLELPDSAYLCGMWRPRLEHDLMWRKKEFQASSPQNIRVAGLPSWSWLSLCADIRIWPNWLIGDLNVSRFITAEILEASTVPCHDVFGPVSSGKVVLRAPLCQVTIRKEDRPFYPHRKDKILVINVNGLLLREEEHFTIRPDDTTDTGMRQILNTPIYLMLGRASKRKVTDYSSGEAVAHPEDLSCILKTTSAKLSLLDGQDYEILILKETGQFGQFQRVSYLNLESVAYTSSHISNGQVMQPRGYARDLLYKHFAHSNIPDSICGRPDHAGLYTVTLV
ncbi:MAG: hypothetical protein M1821_005130 [Bathelium mastoideum]|nr:MAG: hypothetical protein M1821_005130 [Bathelium mastoideum]